MKRRFLAIAALSLLGAVAAGPAYAADFALGEETKGVTFTSNESDMNIRVRLQPRLDYGDIIESQDGTSYEADGDLYLRRVRLEIGGHLLTKTIKYNLTLSGDRWDQANHTNSVKVFYAYVEWEIDPAVSLMVGKEKLPYSRVSLTSSSKQLLIERPVSTEAAKALFGKTDPYYQPKLELRGSVLEGMVGYAVAIADGWQNNEAIYAAPARAVFKADPLYVLRADVSPPGWVEGKKSDAHLGVGQHLTVGANAAVQRGIEYSNGSDEDRKLWGLDVSGHMGPWTAQAEYNQWTISSNDAAIADIRARGWYVQGGYFVAGPNFEPVARYEVYNHDTTRDDMKEKVTTVGVNWYGKGHSFKVGANWAHTKFEDNAREVPNADKKDVFQVQAQLYF